MTVMIIATGETKEYNASYCARLIEQGEAVRATKPKRRSERLKKTEVTEDVTEVEDS